MAYTNAVQRIPNLFKAIMENDYERERIKRKGEYMTTEDWRELARLQAEHKEFMKAAEETLRWNTNKGNSA